MHGPDVGNLMMQAGRPVLVVPGDAAQFSADRFSELAAGRATGITQRKREPQEKCELMWKIYPRESAQVTREEDSAYGSTKKSAPKENVAVPRRAISAAASVTARPEPRLR